MPKKSSNSTSRKLDALLETLNQIQAQFPTEQISEQPIAELRQILQSKYAVAVARTAKLIGRYEITELVPDLITAFDRFLTNPAKIDPNCLAKAGIADALYHLEQRAEAVFLAGIRHVQMEPVWGGQVDTAPRLREICAMGLVRMNYPDVMTELADLLADPEPPARIGAARAIAYSENPQGIPLLRLRAKIGDEPPVLAECVTALLKLDAERSLPFAASFLSDPQPQTQELIALALGESRHPGAFEPLQIWWKFNSEPDLRRTALLAIAMLRQDQPLDFLISLIAKGRNLDAHDAVAALDLYRQDALLWRRVREAAQQRGDAELMAIVEPVSG
jgi:HEAT repeat protein